MADCSSVPLRWPLLIAAHVWVALKPWQLLPSNAPLEHSLTCVVVQVCTASFYWCNFYALVSLGIWFCKHSVECFSSHASSTSHSPTVWSHQEKMTSSFAKSWEQQQVECFLKKNKNFNPCLKHWLVCPFWVSVCNLNINITSDTTKELMEIVISQLCW